MDSKIKILILESKPAYIWYLKKTVLYLKNNYNVELFFYYNKNATLKNYIEDWNVKFIDKDDELKDLNISIVLTSYVHFHNSQILKEFYYRNIPIILVPHGFYLCLHCSNIQTLPGCDCWLTNQNFLSYIPTASKKLKQLYSKHWGIEKERIVPLGNLELDYYLDLPKKETYKKHNKKKKVLIFLRYELPAFIKTNNQYLRDLLKKVSIWIKKENIEDIEFIIKPHPLDSDFLDKYKIDFPYKILVEPWRKNIKADIYNYTYNMVNDVDFIIAPNSSIVVLMLAIGKKVIMPINPNNIYNKKLMKFYKGIIDFWYPQKNKTDMEKLFLQDHQFKLPKNIKDYISDFWDGKTYKRFGDFVYQTALKNKNTLTINIPLETKLKNRFNLFPKNQIVAYEIVKFYYEKGKFLISLNILKQIKNRKKINPLLAYYILNKEDYFSKKEIESAKKKTFSSIYINTPIYPHLLHKQKDFLINMFLKIKNIEHGTIGWLNDLLYYFLLNDKSTKEDLKKIISKLKKSNLFNKYKDVIKLGLIYKNKKSVRFKEIKKYILTSKQNKTNFSHLRKFIPILIIYLINKKELKKADILINIMMELFPNDSEVNRLYTIMQTKLEKGNVNKVKKIAKNFRDDYEIQFNYAYILLAHNKFNKAFNILKHIIYNNIVPFYIRFNSLLLIGDIYKKEKNLTEWRAEVNEFIENNKKDFTLYNYYELFRKLVFLGEKKEALTFLNYLFSEKYIDLYLLNEILKFSIENKLFASYKKSITLEKNFSKIKFTKEFLKNLYLYLILVTKREKPNEYKQYLNKFLSIVKEKNKQFPLYYKLGESEYNEKIKKTYYRKAIKLILYKRKKSDDEIYKIGLIYKKLKRHRESTIWFKKLLKNNNNPNLLSAAYFHLGEISKILNKKSWKSYYKKGIEILKKKKEKLPTDFYHIGYSYKNLKDFKNATTWFKKSLKNNDNPNLLSAAYFHLGEISKTLNKKSWKSYYKKGIEILKKKKEKFPVDLYRIGSFYKQLKDFKNAKLWFKKTAKNTIDTNLLSGAYFHLGEIELELNHKKQAIEYFKKCLKLNPEHRKAKEDLKKLIKEKKI